MDDLADRYADRGVTSVFVYIREAHPAENYRHHTSMSVKRANALEFRDYINLRRPLLLDDLEGTVHHAYGLLPNMAWIIGPGGAIYYKAAWTAADDIDDALGSLLSNLADRRSKPLAPLYSERVAWRVSNPEAFRAGLERNGPQAVTDFYGSGPG